jgi:hypothetical protein
MGGGDVTDEEMLQEMTDEELQGLYDHLLNMMQEVSSDELIHGSAFQDNGKPETDAVSPLMRN